MPGPALQREAGARVGTTRGVGRGRSYGQVKGLRLERLGGAGKGVPPVSRGVLEAQADFECSATRAASFSSGLSRSTSSTISRSWEVSTDPVRG
jgi:hypothetical protein